MKGKIFILIFAFIFVVIGVSGIGTAALTSDLIHYYKMDETSGTIAEDSIGNKNGTHVGDIDLGFTSVDSELGTAYNSSSGTGASVDVNSSSQGDSITINMWVNPEAYSGFDGLVNAWGDGENSYILRIRDGGGNYSWIVRDNLGTQNSLEGGGAPDIGNWAMVTALYNSSSGEQKIYENGVEVASQTGDSNPIADWRLDQIGKGIGNDRSWEGKYDEFAIWNRTLGDGEITELYNGGAGNQYPFSGSISVSLNSPSNDTSTTSTSQVFNATVSPKKTNLTNATIHLWFKGNGSLWKKETNTISGDVSKSTTWNITDIPIDTFVWNVFGNGENSTGDVFTDWADDNRTFTRDSIAIDSQIWNNKTFETQSEKFNLNISTIDDVLSIDARLNYDGESFPAAEDCSGGKCNISSTIDIPLVNTNSHEQNKSFFWNLTIFDGTNEFQQVTTENDQEVEKITLSECSGTSNNHTQRYMVFAEKNKSSIDPFEFQGTFDFWLGDGTVKQNTSFENKTASNFDLCMDPKNRTFMSDAQIEYDDTKGNESFLERNFFFEQKELNNDTEEIDLFLLENSESTTFILKVQDGSLQPISEALVKIQKFYPSNNSFETVQVAKTDDNGESVAFYKTETVDYRHIVEVDGETKLVTSKQKVVGKEVPFTLIFTIGADKDKPWQNFDDNESLDTTLTFNETTNIVTFEYVDDVAIGSSFGRLLVFKEFFGNDTRTVICDKNSTRASATLTCNVTGNNGTIIAKGFIGEDEKLVELINFIVSEADDIIGDEGLLMAFFILLTAGMAFVFDPTAGIVSTNIALIFVNIIGLVSLSPLFIFGIMGASIVIIILMKR